MNKNSYINGTTILNGWADLRSNYDLGDQEVMETLRNELIADLIIMTSVTPEQGANLEAFMYDLPNGLRPGVFQGLASKAKLKVIKGEKNADGTNKYEPNIMIAVNKYIAPAICAAFGIQAGAAGVGQLPKKL
jgi:hypothetical protein